MKRTLAERVAEVFRDSQWDRIPERAMPLIAEFVLAAEDKGDCGCGERGFVPCVCGGVAARRRYDAALAALAKALGVEP